MQQIVMPPKNANKNDQDITMICHLLGFCGFIMPILHIGAPLLFWLWKKDTSEDLDRHGREVINFQLSWTIYFFIATVLCIILIGFVLLGILAISWVILVIIGALAAKRGELYRYPLTIRFFSPEP
tara:strand:- start:7634 stop:8011 length:378 start_codon:yes stop_codon:yes gene_type:complete